VKRMGSALAETARATELMGIRKLATEELGITQAGLEASKVEQQRWAIKVLTKIEDIKADQKKKFSEEEHKDLESRDRRGIESAMDYELRREAGMPEKNERDDPKSTYSKDSIEDGLLLREAQNGIEYGVLWSKQGEMVQIAKGEKGMVATHAGDDAYKGGTFTHSHPTNYDLKDPETHRPHGLAFSAGDVNHHQSRQLDETRAVAVEGKYSFVAPVGSTRLDAGTEKEMRRQALTNQSVKELVDKYDASPAGRHSVTMQLVAIQMDDKNPSSPVNRAMGEVAKLIAIERVREATQRVHEGKAPPASISAVKSPSVADVGRDPRFLARQNQYTAELLNAVGAKYTFTPNKGYEFMNDPKAKEASNRGVVQTATFPHRDSPLDKDGNTIKRQRATAPQSASEAVKKMSPKKEPKPKPPTDILSKPPKASPPPAPPKPVAPPSPPPTLGGSLRMGGGGVLRRSLGGLRL